MSAKFNAHIAIASAFSTQGGKLIGFEIQPISEEADEIIHVEDDEAEYWGIYARIQEPDGQAALAHWVADIDKQAEAQAFCDILNQIQAELTATKQSGDFIHTSIEGNLEILDNQQPYNFLIERNTAGWKLYITEADTDLEFDYNTKDEAEHDVRMAAKHFQLELIDISALPSVG
jgi:hypothetical protein